MKPIKKTETECHYTITFAVLVPDEEDYAGHLITKDEIIKTAHDFMLHLDDKSINVDHEDGTDMPDVKIVESYILPVDLEFDDGLLPAGSWMVALLFEDHKLYQDVLDGLYVGVSMEGAGVIED